MAPPPVPKNYKNLFSAFAFYAEYHNNAVNQLIHIICVPLILVTAMVFLSYTDASGLFPASVNAFCVKHFESTPSAAFIGALVYCLYYIYLTPNALGVIAVGMIGLFYTTAMFWRLQGGGLAWQTALGVHVIAWIAQFYGHGVHEGRSPALLDNLFQALFMAPIFVLIEVLMKAGHLKDLSAAMEPEVQARLKKFKAAKAPKTH